MSDTEDPLKKANDELEKCQKTMRGKELALREYK